MARKGARGWAPYVAARRRAARRRWLLRQQRREATQRVSEPPPVRSKIYLIICLPSKGELSPLFLVPRFAPQHGCCPVSVPSSA
jgi:hypothetical protein